MRRSLPLRVRVAVAMGILVGLVTVLVTLTGRSISLEILEEVRQSEAPPGGTEQFELSIAEHVAQAEGVDPWREAGRALDGVPPDLGVLVVDTEGGLRYARPQDWSDGKVEWDGRELVFRRTRSGEESTIVVTGGTPLVAAGDRIGTAFVLSLPRPPERWVTRRWIGVAVGGIALGTIAAWFLAGGLTGPVRELTDAARRLADGDRSVQVTSRARDEVGELARAFNELVASLRDLEAARRRLVSDTAHELRTPLTRLRCRLEAAEDGLLDLGRDGYRAMLSDVGDLQKLVEDLQVLALAESGQLELDREVHSIADLVRPLASDPSRAGRLVLNGPESARIRVDGPRFRQILGNLLDNAFRWSPPASSVRLTWTRCPRGWEISVIDEGPGLASDEQSRVFERFYRTEPSRARDSGGSGLGLTIVRRLAEAHGGRVGVDSRPGRGSRFWVLLPDEESGS